MNKEQYKKVVEDNGNIIGCILGSITWIGFIFLIFDCFEEFFPFTFLLLVLSLWVVYEGWSQYLSSRKVYWEKIK